MPTEFERCVYRVVRRIPPGRVATYGAVAAAVGCGSPRAVGQALRRNPFAPRVPCHRVIAADLSLGGFRGRRSGAALRLKRHLLAREGVAFVRGRLADPSRLFLFERPSAESPRRRGVANPPPAPRSTCRPGSGRRRPHWSRRRRGASS